MMRFAIIFALALGACSASQDSQSNLVAIDVLLDPDQEMWDMAVETNLLLRENYPAGFALGTENAPHVTVLQRFVLTDDIEEVIAAVQAVNRRTDPTTFELTATGYYYTPHETLGLAGITVAPTPELLSYQAEIIAAVEPFSVENGTGAAFVQRPDGAVISRSTVDNMNAFVLRSSGENYDPHITLGLADPTFLDSLLEEPFVPVRFKPASVSIYQLGDIGTAQKKLWPSGEEPSS